jgi:hypothetical protein
MIEPDHSFSYFIGLPPVLEELPDGKMWRVHEEFEYRSKLLGLVITIPKGFVTDGASVPSLFQNIIAPWGKWGPAAIVHDYLYRWQGTTQRQADDVLLEAMRVLEVDRFRQFAIWSAVRMFGASAWREDAKNPIHENTTAWRSQ